MNESHFEEGQGNLPLFSLRAPALVAAAAWTKVQKSGLRIIATNNAKSTIRKARCVSDPEHDATKKNRITCMKSLFADDF
jgi:hypothetical protein